MEEERHSRLQDNNLLLINFCTQILCYAVVTIFVLLRLIVRINLRQPFTIEDGMY